MDDSPRSSKRRKLDTPKRIVSSPVIKGSTTRASGRLSNRSTSYTVGGAQADVPSLRKGQSAKATGNGTATKNIIPSEIDVYDDFEGALGIGPKKSSLRQSLSASREGTESMTDELQDVTTTPKRGKGRPKNAQSAKRSSAKTLANGHQHGLDGEEDNQDELGADGQTPSKSGRRTKAPTARPRAVEKISGARKTPIRKEAQKADTEGPIATPTSRLSKRRKPLEELAEGTVIPETEDESSRKPPTSTHKRTPAIRRRANRTDNISNGIDDVDVEDDHDMDVDGNSVLDSILDPTEPSPFNKPTPTQKEKAVSPFIYGNLPSGLELDLLKTIVLERITAKRPSPLVGLDTEYKSVHQIIEQTVTAGEGNSMLLIGARGSGKTALVNKVLSEVAKDNRSDYHVIRLNGFIHTDDKIALREIWRQLGKEMDIEEDGSGPGKNYADTLATLLALLSHPSEQTGEVTDQVAKAVIFIIDEFDLFAQHPRQTLLYNLFDIAQSRKAPIAVLGLTTRIDVIDSLEKRVKSRFSHRYVHLRLAKTFTAFQEICKAGLIIEPDYLSVEERGILEGGVKDVAKHSTPAKKGNMTARQDVLSDWNANIEKLFANPSFLTQQLAPHFYRTKSVTTVLNSFFLPTATLSADTPFAPTNTLIAPDSKLFLLPHLSTLALSLLISTARLDIIHDSDTCNFNMAYDEYVTLASKARIQSAAGGLSASGSVSKVWGKDVARREWETLVELGLIMPVIQGQAGGFGMIRCDVALEEIGIVLAGEKGMDRHLERWCKAI
ncbi:origin recognition complex subunit 4 C-terminus-domain-containing protein [Phaeosphaeria sp. MPI-PUGE-AT-0046c]|nr:origin recognition complex subunit 4 C-terminus-domain-containing protein [Phaeosphaeria sp. MPI-PUGE-AT-0046c]